MKPLTVLLALLALAACQSPTAPVTCTPIRQHPECLTRTDETPSTVPGVAVKP
jgi:uncharacterized lipoprotein YajG